MTKTYKGRVELSSGTFSDISTTAVDLMSARRKMEAMYPGKKVFSVTEAR